MGFFEQKVITGRTAGQNKRLAKNIQNAPDDVSAVAGQAVRQDQGGPGVLLIGFFPDAFGKAFAGCPGICFDVFAEPGNKFYLIGINSHQGD